MFVILSIFIWPLHCLSFSDLRFLGSISQKVVSLRLIVSVISKLLIGWNSHLRLILDLQLFVKSTTDYHFDIFTTFLTLTLILLSSMLNSFIFWWEETKKKIKSDKYTEMDNISITWITKIQDKSKLIITGINKTIPVKVMNW